MVKELGRQSPRANRSAESLQPSATRKAFKRIVTTPFHLCSHQARIVTASMLSCQMQNVVNSDNLTDSN